VSATQQNQNHRQQQQQQQQRTMTTTTMTMTTMTMTMTIATAMPREMQVGFYVDAWPMRLGRQPAADSVRRRASLLQARRYHREKWGRQECLQTAPQRFPVELVDSGAGRGEAVAASAWAMRHWRQLPRPQSHRRAGQLLIRS
jgi:hypothetical protein